MDPNKGYWHRQFYFLSSLGLFYVILIALFAVPLLGTFVVILIKGALDLRYVIIAAGCVGLIAMLVLAVRLFRRLWLRFRQDGPLVGEAVRRSLNSGQSIEISILNGMLKFSCGGDASDLPLARLPENHPMLPLPDARSRCSGIIDQLQHLSALRESGAIDSDEFNMLKSMLIEPSAPSCILGKKDPR